jgi:hypothetical protein
MKIILFGKEILNVLNKSDQEKEPISAQDIPHIDPRIQSFINDQQMQDLEYEKEMERFRKEFNSNKLKAKSAICPNVRKANIKDYMQWLRGFLDTGNKPTHYYSYPFDQWGTFYIATKNFEIIPLYGSASINIIVPKDIKITGNPGHSNLLLFDGYKSTIGLIPVFSDTLS